jgi:hypothetical protein
LIPFGLSDFAKYYLLLFAVEATHFNFAWLNLIMLALAKILLCIFKSCLVSRDRLLKSSLDRAIVPIAVLHVIIESQDFNL